MSASERSPAQQDSLATDPAAATGSAPESQAPAAGVDGSAVKRAAEAAENGAALAASTASTAAASAAAPVADSTAAPAVAATKTPAAPSLVAEANSPPANPEHAKPAAAKPAPAKPAPAKPAAAKAAPAKPAPAKPAQAAKPPVAEAAQPEVVAPPAVVRTGPTAAEVARTVRRERAQRLFRSLLLWVVMPTLLGTIYYGFVAATQYESVATLVVNRSVERADLATTLLREHMLSRDMLRVLDTKERFSEHYARGGDFLSRLSPDARSETRYAYFLKQVDARYDQQAHVFTLRVRGFSGDAARRFATAILREANVFVEQTTGVGSSPLIVAAKPSLPDEATYPRRGYGILTVFFASLCLFAIGSLLIAALREHAQF